MIMLMLYLYFILSFVFGSPVHNGFKGVAGLEDVMVNFLIPIDLSTFFPIKQHPPSQIYKKLYGKLENSQSRYILQTW